MVRIGIEDESVNSLGQILSRSKLPVVVTDALAPDHPIVFVNEAFESETGYSAEESLGRNCRFLQGLDNEQPDLEKVRRALEDGNSCECVVRNYRKDTSLFWNHLYLYPIRNPRQRITHFVGIQHDVTTVHEATANLLELRNAFENSDDVRIETALEVPRSKGGDQVVDTSVAVKIETGTGLSTPPPQDDAAARQAKVGAWSASEKVKAVLDSIKEGCFSVDREWCFTYINEQGARWLDRRAEDLIGSSIWHEFPDAVGGIYYQTYYRAMSTHSYAECDAYYPPVGRWLNARAYPSEEGLTVFFLDVSERKREEERMQYAALHDQLTGLMNRDACLGKVEETLAQASEERLGPLAVLFIDLDKFKEVNDALGHRAGDHVLRLLGERLKALSTELRYCARLSGDEFLFVLDPSSASQAQAFATRLLDQIVKPFDVAGQRLTLGASIGIAMAAIEDPVSGSDLINNADTAMYAAKASGRLAVRMFSAEAERISRRRLQLRNEMASAIQAGQFVLHYQPQIRLPDRSLGGVEALVRWNHPVHGLLSPAAFLDIAEESPLILQLGAWVCEEACRQLALWSALGHELRVAINVSARQLVDPNFPQIIDRATRLHGVDPRCIELEITESMLAQDMQVSSDVLTQLARQGFRVALDDFGTGFSNLAYINRLPVTAIKIDKSFIADIEVDPKSMELVKCIVALGKSLGLAVICEGVERQAQLLALERTQCDMIQGYLISRPLPAHELFERFLKSG